MLFCTDSTRGEQNRFWTKRKKWRRWRLASSIYLEWKRVRFACYCPASLVNEESVRFEDATETGYWIVLSMSYAASIVQVEWCSR